jgi:hypothetical protein
VGAATVAVGCGAVVAIIGIRFIDPVLLFFAVVSRSLAMH